MFCEDLPIWKKRIKKKDIQAGEIPLLFFSHELVPKVNNTFAVISCEILNLNETQRWVKQMLSVTMKLHTSTFEKQNKKNHNILHWNFIPLFSLRNWGDCKIYTK